MKRELQGHYVTISTVGERVQAFVPAALPPSPPIEWSASLREKFDQALLALGRLDSVSVLLPDTSLFVYMYVRKEAVLSSMIEGTQSSLSDLLLYEFEQIAASSYLVFGFLMLVFLLDLHLIVVNLMELFYH